jgi:hypothetical protein
MKIQLLIRRKHGSTTTLGDKSYVFNDANDHTCEVTDEAHIAWMLGPHTGGVYVEKAEKRAAAKVEAIEEAPAEAPRKKPGRKPKA